jgi:hypothetical protein
MSKMKRTRSTRDVDALYTDPVTQEAPTRPLVLTQCGHTIDQGYLPTLEQRAKDSKAALGYCCLVCDQVSTSAVRNFALETALQLVDVQGPARFSPATPPRQLAALEHLHAPLSAAINTARDRPWEKYQRVCSALLAHIIIPQITLDEVGVTPMTDMGDIFQSASDVLGWLHFENGRYTTEFLASHQLRIRAIPMKVDYKASLEVLGWWKFVWAPDCREKWEECTEAEFAAARLTDIGIEFVVEFV